MTGRYPGAIVGKINGGNYIIDVNGLLYDCVLPEKFAGPLWNARGYTTYYGKSYAKKILVDVFLEYKGLELCIPNNTKYGENIVDYTGVPWKEIRNETQGLRYVFMGKYHPFKRPPKWLLSKENFPHGQIHLTGK